jgi:hypothetical protein
MGEISYLDRLLPGFHAMGFAGQLNALLKAANSTSVRANLPALVAALGADGVVVTADASQPDLLATWNALCDQLNADVAIILKDYDNCKVATLEDFGVKWNQCCVALDREAALSGTYAATFGYLVCPYTYQ